MYYVPAFGSGFWSFNSVSLFLLSALNYCRPRREEHSPLNRELLLRGTNCYRSAVKAVIAESSDL